MEKEFETLLSYIDYASLNNKENVDEVYEAWERIKAENERLKGENTKLKCLALRYISERLYDKYLHGFCVNKERVKRHVYFYLEAYRKAKKALREGK